MDALLSKSCSSTGRTPMGAKLSGPAGFGETLRDDNSGSSAPHDGAADEGQDCREDNVCKGTSEVPANQADENCCRGLEDCSCKYFGVGA